MIGLQLQLGFRAIPWFLKRAQRRQLHSRILHALTAATQLPAHSLTPTCRQKLAAESGKLLLKKSSPPLPIITPI